MHTHSCIRHARCTSLPLPYATLVPSPASRFCGGGGGLMAVHKGLMYDVRWPIWSLYTGLGCIRRKTYSGPTQSGVNMCGTFLHQFQTCACRTACSCEWLLWTAVSWNPPFQRCQSRGGGGGGVTLHPRQTMAYPNPCPGECPKCLLTARLTLHDAISPDTEKADLEWRGGGGAEGVQRRGRRGSKASLQCENENQSKFLPPTPSPHTGAQTSPPGGRLPMTCRFCDWPQAGAHDA